MISFLLEPRVSSLAATAVAILVLSLSSQRLSLDTSSLRDSVLLLIAALGASFYIASIVAGPGAVERVEQVEQVERDVAPKGEETVKETVQEKWKRCMPRKIILIRHGESEGNVDWKVLSYKPDEKLELTPKGRQQALDAGKAIKAHLREGDRVRFYVSPYLRTRQTFEFITESFGGADQVSSFEEPRLREQDWGNFQNFVEMESIKAERRRYGTFFYRMPHGESGADVYDRISTFLESMYRSLLTKPEPPSVVVIVTHGLLARLFIMRWFRKSVREFQSWRSLNNCELLVMERNDEQRRYDFDSSTLVYRPPPPNAPANRRMSIKQARRESLRILAEEQEREALATLSNYYSGGQDGQTSPRLARRDGIGRAMSAGNVSLQLVPEGLVGGSDTVPTIPPTSTNRGRRKSMLPSHGRRSITVDTTPSTSSIDGTIPSPVLPPLGSQWTRPRSFTGTSLGENPFAYSSAHIFRRNANFDSELEEETESEGEGDGVEELGKVNKRVLEVRPLNDADE